jgi:mono/diheme cytochrome c family protein
MADRGALRSSGNWLACGAIVVSIAVLAWPAWIYISSERVLQRTYPLEAQRLPAPGPDAVAQGRRLADLYGCTSCHGDDLRGAAFPEPEPFRHVNAANLTLKASAYTDEDIARIVRRGVRPDGRSVWVMPAEGYVRVSDTDMAALTAYLRSLAAGGVDLTLLETGWEARRQIGSGAFAPGVDLVQRALAAPPIDAGPAFARGRYLADAACTECHGSALGGSPSGKPPDLRIAAAYDLDTFRHFMKSGKAAGNRELTMMSAAARKRFSHFTDAEIDQLHAYLVARADILDAKAVRPAKSSATSP